MGQWSSLSNCRSCVLVAFCRARPLTVCSKALFVHIWVSSAALPLYTIRCGKLTSFETDVRPCRVSEGRTGALRHQRYHVCSFSWWRRHRSCTARPAAAAAVACARGASTGRGFDEASAPCSTPTCTGGLCAAAPSTTSVEAARRAARSTAWPQPLWTRCSAHMLWRCQCCRQCCFVSRLLRTPRQHRTAGGVQGLATHSHAARCGATCCCRLVWMVGQSTWAANRRHIVHHTAGRLEWHPRNALQCCGRAHRTA